MQAQAAGEGAQGLLQNPKVQIGVIAGGAIALIVVIFLLFFNNSAAPAPDPGGVVPGGAGLAPGGMPGAVPPVDGTTPVAGGAPAAPGGFGAPGLAPAAAPMGSAAAPGGAPTEAPAPASGPGVPVRKNPFVQNKELAEVLKSIPEDPKAPAVTAQAHNIYVEELYKPKPVVQVGDQEEDPGPPIPTMRVAGVVYGRQVTATLQIGQQYMQVTPGQMIPASNPVYRVESIEQDTVHLSRRWEIGNRKGVQRIEVGLAARAATQGGAGMGGPGMGGYPGAGYPGAMPNF